MACCDTEEWSTEKKMETTAFLSGMAWGGGMWFFIDGMVYGQHVQKNGRQGFEFIFVLPGIFATLGMVMMNMFHWADLSGNGLDQGAATRARLLLFFGFVVAIVSIFLAVFFMIDNYMDSDARATGTESWPGVCMIIQTALIFIGSSVLRWGHSDDSLVV